MSIMSADSVCGDKCHVRIALLCFAVAPDVVAFGCAETVQNQVRQLSFYRPPGQRFPPAAFAELGISSDKFVGRHITAALCYGSAAHEHAHAVGLAQQRVDPVLLTLCEDKIAVTLEL